MSSSRATRSGAENRGLFSPSVDFQLLKGAQKAALSAAGTRIFNMSRIPVMAADRCPPFAYDKKGKGYNLDGEWRRGTRCIRDRLRSLSMRGLEPRRVRLNPFITHAPNISITHGLCSSADMRNLLPYRCRSIDIFCVQAQGIKSMSPLCSGIFSVDQSAGDK